MIHGPYMAVRTFSINRNDAVLAEGELLFLVNEGVFGFFFLNICEQLFLMTLAVLY